MLEALANNPELLALLVPLLASAVSALFPDKSSNIMKIINVIALNIGKAKNNSSRNV